MSELRLRDFPESVKVIPGVKGVCCSCQQGHPVVSVPVVNYADFMPKALGEEHEQYVMAPHSIYADIYADPELRKKNPILLMCGGVDTMPQAVYKD